MSCKNTTVGAHATWAAMICSAVVTGCAPRAIPSASQPSSSAENSCITTDSPPPATTGRSRVQYPTSQLILSGQLSEHWINAQLDEHLPVVVAQEKDRPVGVAGRASYRIKRGSLSLEQRAGVLWATLPLSLDISVCKPFGAGCFRYGSCTPRLDIEMLIDGDFSSQYELNSPSLSSMTKEGCRIGIDVTPQIESTARGELAKIQRQLDQTFSQVDEAVASWALEPHAPLRLWQEQCVSWSVTGVKQRPLRVEHLDKDVVSPGKHLTVGLQATGQLAVVSCGGAATSAPSRPLPAPRISQKLAKTSQLHIPERISLENLRNTLLAQLDEPLGAHRIDDVQWASDGVYIRVKFGGDECGTAWFKAQLRVVGDALRFAPPVALTPSVTRSMQRVSAQLSEHFILPLRGAAWLKQEGKPWLLGLIASAQAQLDPQDLDVAVMKFHVKPGMIQVVPDGIHVFHTASFQLRLNTTQRRSVRGTSLEAERD